MDFAILSLQPCSFLQVPKVSYVAFIAFFDLISSTPWHGLRDAVALTSVDYALTKASPSAVSLHYLLERWRKTRRPARVGFVFDS